MLMQRASGTCQVDFAKVQGVAVVVMVATSGGLLVAWPFFS